MATRKGEQKRTKKPRKQKKPAWIIRLLAKRGYVPGRVMREVLEWAEVLVVAGALAALIMSFVTVRMHVPTDSMWPTINGDRSMWRADSFFVDRITYYFRNPKPGDIVVFRHPLSSTIRSVDEGSPAADAGVVPGEHILASTGHAYLNETPLYTASHADDVLRRLPEGTSIELLTYEGHRYSLGEKTSSIQSLADLGIRTSEKLMRYVKRLIAVGGQTVQIRGTDVYVDGEKLEGERFDRDYDSSSSLYQYGIEPTRVPEGCYFMLGDNSNDSFDSRYWGFVAQRSIIGVPYLRIWPPSRFGLL